MRSDIKLAVLQLAELYGEKMTQTRLELYDRVLSDLSPDEIKAAVDLVVKDAKIYRMPLPAVIKNKARAQIDEDAIGKLIASRVMHAVSKYGWPNPEEAFEYVGEVGWRVVERWGGWKYICENLGATIQLTTFQAQCRDLAKAMQTQTEKALDRPVITSGSADIKKLVSIGLNEEVENV